MKRFLLSLSAVLLFPAPSALAAYGTPADLMNAVRTDATPRSWQAEAHVSATPDQEAFFISVWMKGRTQGGLERPSADMSMTFDVVMPSSQINVRAKAHVRVVEKKMYLMIDSVSGSAGEGNIQEVVGEMLGKWMELPIQDSKEFDNAFDTSEILNGDVLKMERTQGKDGSMYSVTMDRNVLRAALELLKSAQPEADVSNPKINFHTVVITDHADAISNSRLYLSVEIPDFSFVMQFSSEKLAGSFTVTAPADAIPLPTQGMMPSFGGGGSSVVPTDPRASGVGKYDARAAARALRQRTSKPKTTMPVSSSNGFLTIGQANAPVTLTEYTDFECPFCRRFQSETYPQLKADYIDTGKVRLVIRHFPLSFHEHAMDAAVAVECARQQGNDLGVELADSIWILQDVGNELTPQNIAKYAQMSASLDMAAWNKCVSSDSAAAAIDRDIKAAGEAEVYGTPTFLLTGPNGGKDVLPGAMPYASFTSAIDALLK